MNHLIGSSPAATLSSLQPPPGTPGFDPSVEVGMKCNCLPACSETIYDLNIINTKRSEELRAQYQ